MKKLFILTIVLTLISTSVLAQSMWIPQSKRTIITGGIPYTAFGEIMTGELHPQFQSSFEYTVNNSLINSISVTNGGTVTQSNGMAVVSSSTTTNSTSLMKSTNHAKYRAGIGGSGRFTALFTSPVAGTEQYVGVVDDVGSSEAFKNGLVVGYDGTVFGFHRFQNDVKFSVNQADWDDPLDGTGASGMTLDHTKLNVFFIQYQYLGAGAMKLYVEDDDTGEPVLVHMIEYTNQNTSPSTYNPNYHISFFVDNGSTSSNITIKTASYAFFIEGKTEFTEIHQPQFSSGEQSQASITSSRGIVTIKSKANYAGKTNYIDSLLEIITASVEADGANNLASVSLIKNATLAGSPTFTDINSANSVMSLSTDATTVSGGTTLMTVPLAGKNDKLIFNLTNLKVLIHEGDTISVVGTSVGTATIKASLLWKELF